MSTRIGYRVGEPEEKNARKLIEFEVEELGNEHLIQDLANVLGTKATLKAVLSALHYRYGQDAVAMWLCDSPEWAEKRYGPGEACSVEIPAGAIVGSDLGPDGKLWIWRARSNPIRFIEVRFLKASDAIRGTDSKTYGPYKKGDVAALPRENASMLMKLGVAERRFKIPGKPPFKKVISGEVLTAYQEAARVKPLVPELTLEQMWDIWLPSDRKSMLLSAKYPYADIDITVNKKWNELSDGERRAIRKAWKALPSGDEENASLKRTREKVEKVLKDIQEARRE